MNSRRIITSRCIQIYLLLFCFYFLISDGHFFSTDEIHIYQTSRSLVENGNLTIDCINDAVTGRDGLCYSQKAILPALLATPLYWLGEKADRNLPDSARTILQGKTIGKKGLWSGSVPIFFVDLMNVFITPLLCVVFFLVLIELGCSLEISTFFSIVLGTSTAVMVYAQTMFNHNLVALAFCLAIYASLRFQRSKTRRRVWAFIAGFSMAIAALTRFETLFVAPAILLPLCVSKCRKHGFVFRQLDTLVAVFTLPLLAAIVITLQVNYWRFGSFFTFGAPQNTSFANPLFVGLYGHLFSIGRSIFLFSPIIFLAILGSAALYRRASTTWFQVFLVATISLVTYSKFHRWHGDWGWGNRYLLPIVPLLLLSVAMWIDESQSRAKVKRMLAVCSLSVVGTFIQVLGIYPFIPSIFKRWDLQDLNPPLAYLYIPSLSPFAAHWNALVNGKFNNFWLFWVYNKSGFPIAATIALPPLIGCVAMLFLILRGPRVHGASISSSDIDQAQTTEQREESEDATISISTIQPDSAEDKTTIMAKMTN